MRNFEPITAVVRGGKRSLRARITAREALSNVILGPEVYICPSVCSAEYCDVKKNPYFVKRMRNMGSETTDPRKRGIRNTSTLSGLASATPPYRL